MLLSAKFTILISWSPICMCNLKHVNEFVSTSGLMQSRKYKIHPNDITERFLFSLFDSSIMTQVVDRVCTEELYF